jgi:argininosuccinate synthase
MASSESGASPTKIVLAYSGGLDTSVILPWLKERYPNTRVAAFVCDLGQGDDMKYVAEKAKASGADEVVIRDCRKDFLDNYCFAMLRARAIYDGDYMLGTAIARPLIARQQVMVARQLGADAVAHGATGKGNDQVRFELTYMALAPELKIIAPWKDPKFQLDSREAALEYARAHGVPVEATAAKIYSRDANIWHMSHEGGEIENPAQEPADDCYVLSCPVSMAPDTAEYVTIQFEGGVPVGLNNEQLDSIELVTRLNEIAGRHGVGQAILVENRVVGLKSRGVYETPAGAVLYEAHKSLDQLCCERDLFHYKQHVSVKLAEMIYYGQWIHPLREALQAFIDHANRVITGSVRVKLYKGRAVAVGANSPLALYDQQLASFSMGDYDVTAARGFIDLFGLPMKLSGKRQARIDGADAARAPSPDPAA